MSRGGTAGKSGVGIAAIGMIYQQGVSFLSGLLIARVIGASEYGIFNVARNLINLAVVFTKLGLDVGLQRYLGAAVDPTTMRARLMNVARLRGVAAGLATVLVTALAVGGATALQDHIFRFHDFAGVLVVSALALPFLTDLGVLGGAYRGLLRPVPSVVADYIIQPTLRIVLVAVLFLVGLRLWGVVIATTLASMTAALYLARRAHREITRGKLLDGDAPAAPVAPEALVPVLKFSVVLAFTMGVTMATRSLDALSLGHFSTAAAVGQYTLAQTMMVLASIFGAAIGQTIGSQIARHHAANDLPAMQHVMRRTARRTALVTAPVCGLLAGWGTDIIHVFGPTFILPAAVMAVLSTSQFANSILAPSGFALSMTGRHRTELYIQVCGLVTTAVLCLVLVPRFDQVGAAVAAGCGVLFGNLFRVGYVHKVFGIHALDRSLLVIAGVTIALVCGLKLAEVRLAPEHGVIAIVAGGLLYVVGAAALTWSFLLRDDERAEARSKLGPVLSRLGVAR